MRTAIKIMRTKLKDLFDFTAAKIVHEGNLNLKKHENNPMDKYPEYHIYPMLKEYLPQIPQKTKKKYNNRNVSTSTE